MEELFVSCSILCIPLRKTQSIPRAQPGRMEEDAATPRRERCCIQPSRELRARSQALSAAPWGSTDGVLLSHCSQKPNAKARFLQPSIHKSLFLSGSAMPSAADPGSDPAGLLPPAGLLLRMLPVLFALDLCLTVSAPQGCLCPAPSCLPQASCHSLLSCFTSDKLFSQQQKSLKIRHFLHGFGHLIAADIPFLRKPMCPTAANASPASLAPPSPEGMLESITARARRKPRRCNSASEHVSATASAAR